MKVFKFYVVAVHSERVDEELIAANCPDAARGKIRSFRPEAEFISEPVFVAKLEPAS
jgi:hypothetical protein